MYKTIFLKSKDGTNLKINVIGCELRIESYLESGDNRTVTIGGDTKVRALSIGGDTIMVDTVIKRNILNEDNEVVKGKYEYLPGRNKYVFRETEEGVDRPSFPSISLAIEPGKFITSRNLRPIIKENNHHSLNFKESNYKNILTVEFK